MSDLYWLTTLGTLSTVCTIFTVLFGAVFALLGIMSLCSIEHNYGSDFTEEEHKVIVKSFKIVSIIFPILTLCTVFIPSKQDLYTIYGIGTVIDYAKGSKEVQKLPDNAVKCLNIWLEEHQDTISNGK